MDEGAATTTIAEASRGVATVNASLRRRLERARAALAWEEWLKSVEPEVVSTLEEIARNKRAPARERERAKRVLARCYGDRT